MGGKMENKQVIIQLPRNKHAFIEINTCEICGNAFYRRTKQKRGSGTQRGVRKINAKTCSKECSKIRLLKAHKDYGKKWRLKNNEKIKEYHKNWWLKNKNG